MKRNDIVVCSRGYVGVLASGERQPVTYPDGNTGLAYVGYHLSAPVGSPWSSRSPRYIEHAPGLADHIEAFLATVAQ